MATEPTGAGSAPAYEADSNYDVQLLAPIKYNGLSFLPLHHHVMTGAFLTKLSEENADAIGSATKC